MPRLIGLELRLEIDTPGISLREEIAMVPLAIELPQAGHVKLRMPCTLHTSWGDLGLGFENTGGWTIDVPIDGSTHGPTTPAEIRAAIARGIPRP
jgi:hypothetical protein